jgi:RNA polymerase sigma-70 factor (ECF subfamily)
MDASGEHREFRSAGVKANLFTTTHWSVILAAGQEDSPHASRCLAILCQTYWYPLYAYLRGEGHGPHDAEDLTQEFFARFLAKNYLRAVDPSKGKFRSFLLASLKHFLANEWDRRQRVKRGGEFEIVSWDQEMAERRYGSEPAHALTAERLYERRWALILLEQALVRLQKEYTAAGKDRLYATLEPYLSDCTCVPDCPALAAELGLSEGALRVTLHRLRRRFGDLVRAGIAHTVANAGQVEEEVRHLFNTFSG